MTVMMVSGRPSRLPLALAGGRVRVERRGGQRRVTTATGVRVAMGGDGAVTVTAPMGLRGQLCGVCTQDRDKEGEERPCAPHCTPKYPQEPCPPQALPLPTSSPTTSTCSVLGMGHLRTFDRLHHHFPISCGHLLTGICSKPGSFRVLLRGGPGGLHGVDIVVGRMRVGLEPGLVTVNGLPIHLPYNSPTSGLTLERQGWEVTMGTRHGVTLTFDGHHRWVSITAPAPLGGHLCGLCGDMDGDPRNDVGQEDKWKVGSEQRECQEAAGCGKKEGEEEEECGVMVRKEGPFRPCHGLVHPGTYYRDCVADGCHPGGTCRVLAAYAAACRNAGIKALEWRGKDLCPPKCPMGTHYSACVPGCVTPLEARSTPGCSMGPKAPAVGATGSCRTVGQRHFVTFDGAAVVVGDNCSYVVARSCGHQEVQGGFDVTISDPVEGGRRVVVTVEKRRWVMKAGKSREVELDGIPLLLPFCLKDRSTCVSLSHRHSTTSVVLSTTFGLSVAAGPGPSVAITLASHHHNLTCGLCGNFDGHPSNDHLMATGTECHRPCPGPTCPPCHQAPKRAFVHGELCSVLRAPRGPFGSCHPLVNPGVFFDVCLWELCEAPGAKEVLQEVLRAYEAACHQAGARVEPWSIPDVCRESGSMGLGGMGVSLVAFRGL
ncbi:IgGFc-binding protein-like [Ara ararauna]